MTIAGDVDVLEDIARQLDEAEIFNRYLSVKVPYHSHYMEAVKDDLLAAFEGLSSGEASIPLYSTVTGELLQGYSAGAAYWWQNTRATVLFEPAVRRMLDDGYTHFVELGPHPVLAASIFETAGAEKALVLSTQRRNDDDGRALLNCVGALHSNGHDIAWDAVAPLGGGRRIKLPSYPWQSKRFWNEGREATEDLHYDPVHPLLGQSVGAVHPTWEVELSTALAPFLADHRVQGSVVVPGAVYVEMALAAAKATYGSNHGVDDLVFHRALILDDACDPILRTTLREDDGTLEFAAFTATADGEVKWTVTATAELTTLPSPPGRIEARQPAEPATFLGGEEFYLRTHALGFEYGDAFRSVDEMTAGEDWAVAHMVVPPQLTAEVEDYQFHPALIDGAFQTLFGTPVLGQSANGGPYLPTRIRHSAVYGAPQEAMAVHVRVVSATSEQIECDITITDASGDPLAVFDGFTVQSLDASTRMSPERIDRGLYEIDWRVKPDVIDGPREDADDGECPSWLIFADTAGMGDAVAERLRHAGRRVRTVRSRTDEQAVDLIAAHLDAEGDLGGIVDCRALDMGASPAAQPADGVVSVLRLVKAMAEHDVVSPRLYLVTANAQPARAADAIDPDQAALWGIGRVTGHQEFPERWGGLIDVDGADDPTETASRICDFVLTEDAEDQIAIRGEATYVPRLRPVSSLTKAFPTKLTPDGTYVVTGGAGALGRTVATYLAERGARHIVLWSRSQLPSRRLWSRLSTDDPHFAIVDTIRSIERLGARVSTASVDVTDVGQVQAWLDAHEDDDGRPVRGIVHAAGTVADQLLVNASEFDFTRVLAPKTIGTRVLHDVFDAHDLEFFVMFGSAGSAIASPGQGNYAAANAFLDGFARFRRAQGLPALAIGWGPWSVGMVEELQLEKIYAQRGIDLITPASGALILDRLINQNAPNVFAISADWSRARNVGLGGRLPMMFSELDAGESASAADGLASSLLEVLSSTPEPDRLGVVTGHVRHTVAAVFDCADEDIEPDVILDDIGLDSMMAMDFRMRVNSMFSIDLPVLEILKGVSVDSLAVRVLSELQSVHADAVAVIEPQSTAEDQDEDDLGRFIDELSEADLEELLAELEAADPEPGTGGTHP